MTSSLNLSVLESFLNLAKTLSFSRTSQKLKITQSAVSKRIKLLETELQQQLFIRTNQEVALTSQGKILLEQVGPLYNELSSRLQMFSHGDSELGGPIRFACFSEVGEKVFVKNLSQFKKDHPKIQVEMKYLNSVEIVEGVKQGQIDIGVVSDGIILENVRSYPLFDEEIVLVTSAKNASIKPTDLAALPFVTYRQEHQLLGKYLKQIYPRLPLNKLSIEFSVASHRSMIEVLKQHHYYAVLPLLSIQKEVENGSLVVVGQHNLKSKLYLIHQDLTYPILKNEELKKFLLKTFRVKTI